MADLPVYLVHWHAPDWVASSVASILGAPGVSLTVIDNGGAPDLPCRVLKIGQNLGYAAAANVGLREFLAGTPPFCVIGSHDLHVAPDTFERLLAAANRHPDFGILAPDIPETGEEIAPEDDGVVERDWVSGGCMLVRREFLDQVGVFDERFGSYVEDVDLCARGKQLGWRAGTVVGANAYGLGSSDSRRAQILTHANHVFLNAKQGRWLPVTRWMLGLSRKSLFGPERSLHFASLRIATTKIIRQIVLRSPSRKSPSD